jgi:serine/threonine-protein phosphatase Stp1
MRTHVGRRRKLNEDAVLNLQEHGLWAIADGMGGHDAGEVASALVIGTLAELGPASSFENLVGKAMGALDTVNSQLLQMGDSGPKQRIIGSTVVGLIADDTQYECFWAGDSRGYRVRNGEIVQLTKDHSMVQLLIEAGMLEPAEAESHPNANVITRAVGVADVLEVDSVRGALKGGDIFLLASDGLTRLISEAELLAELSRGSPEASADVLLDTALERGAPDNVSFVIVWVT